MSFTDVKIKKKTDMTWGWEWRHALEACAEDLGVFEKSQLVEFLARKKTVGFRLLAEALWRVPHVLGGGRWKSQHRKIAPLSPYVEKPLNSKVIKSFVPELRSRKCFSYFEIPMFCVIYIWTLYIHFAYPYRAIVHIQTTTLLGSARILRRVLKTWGDLSLRLQWKTVS